MNLNHILPAHNLPSAHVHDSPSHPWNGAAYWSYYYCWSYYYTDYPYYPYYSYYTSNRLWYRGYCPSSPYYPYYPYSPDHNQASSYHDHYN